MKHLLVFLKLSVVPVIILPLALNDYNGTLRAHQQAQTADTITQNVSVDNKYLTSNLLDTAKESSENIDSFYNSLPKTSIENDDYSINKEKGQVGVPQVRLAGGLFFDYGVFNATTKKRIGDGMFGDANVTSLNDTIPVQDTMPADDQMASRSAPLTNKEDDLSNFAFQGNRRNGTFNWNMANGQANSCEEDQIVNKSDFNLTPNKVRYVKNKKVQTTASPEKKLFRDIINKELFDWYWTTWAKEYDERNTAEYNLNNALKREGI